MIYLKQVWTLWNTYFVQNTLFFTEHTDLTKFKRQRNRVILGGESCGPVFEEETCQIPNRVCPKYFWVLGVWSHCQLAEDVTCGHGLRTRGICSRYFIFLWFSIDDLFNLSKFLFYFFCDFEDFWCTKDDSPVHVELKHCLQYQNITPSSVERCHVDCQTPCQMTEWSHWSSCPQPCSGLRTRTRDLIGGSISHPACKGVRQVETTQCPCSEYFLEPTSEWSFCLTNETDGCGAGTRYRSLGCYNMDNHLVDPS